MNICNEDISDHSEGSLSLLATNLENKFKVRDFLLDEVTEGFADSSDFSKRHRSIKVLLNSIIVNYGNSVVYHERNQILSKTDLDKILTFELLEEKVAKPIIASEYHNDLLKDSVKLLFASSAYLPWEVYGKLFNTELITTLISISEYAASDIKSNKDIWNSSISTIRNVISQVDLSDETINRLVSCFFNIVDEPSIQISNVMVKILFKTPNDSDDSSPSIINTNLCFNIKLCKRLTEYLSSVLERSQDTQILLTACSSLVCICEQSFGVDLFLQSGGMKKIVDLALIVVSKYEAYISLENKYNKKSEINKVPANLTIEQGFHDLSFAALSVISKIAFSANISQIKFLIENELPEILVQLLSCPLSTSKVKARSCNTLGNLGCETHTEVQALIDSEALTTLIYTFNNDLDHNVRVESAYAICACLSKSNRKQIGYIISCNSKSNHVGDGTCMILISNMLDFIMKCDPTSESSVKLCRVVLNAIENILRVGEYETKSYNLTENPYIKMFKDAEGVVKLSRVCYFPEYHIAKKATMLLEEFFDTQRTWSMESVH